MMFKTQRQYYVYIITNQKGGVLYIGVTNNLERRMYEHKQALVCGFSKRYHLKQLVYFETYQYINDAIKREKAMKKWLRQWKVDLIEKDNPQWEDLAKDWNL